MRTYDDVVLVAEKSDLDYELFRELLEQAVPASKRRPHLLRMRNGCDMLSLLGCTGEKVRTTVRPKLIILDWEMEECGGPEALKAIRADADLADIPVVVFTEGHSHDDERQARSLGVVDFLPKPNGTGWGRAVQALASAWAIAFAGLPVH